MSIPATIIGLPTGTLLLEVSVIVFWSAVILLITWKIDAAMQRRYERRHPGEK